MSRATERRPAGRIEARLDWLDGTKGIAILWIAFFHFFIAFCATSVFLLAARKLPLARRPWLYGALFGVALYLVMNYIVLPLSKIGLRPTPPLVPLINGVAALVFCIGIPLAFIARRYVPRQIS